VQSDKPGNLLLDGGVRKGEPGPAWSACAAVAEGSFETKFVEHAYIEPEAGWARRVGERIEVHVSTQTPYMDRDEIALVMKLAPAQVRVVPTACGGGFGGKLDMAVQPLVALSAWLTGRTVACVYSRPESMASTTKRHPARIGAKFGCDANGRLLACEVDALFDTGAYASWGPTVATRWLRNCMRSWRQRGAQRWLRTPLRPSTEPPTRCRSAATLSSTCRIRSVTTAAKSAVGTCSYPWGRANESATVSGM
jgi:CO/xanthine dehydrogenase Mo-binding subunit